MSLYNKYRPSDFSGVLHQKAANVLEAACEKKSVPHAILFCGPTGTGKTTMARILAKRLGCGGSLDYSELNAAESRGIDDVRRIAENLSLRPMSGDCKVFVIDECQKLTPEAQSAFLKILEDTPGHVYFFFCTTDPEKLLATVRGRLTRFDLSPIPAKVIAIRLLVVAKKEEIPLTNKEADEIADAAEGSLRNALVLLESFSHTQDAEERAGFLLQETQKPELIALARALVAKKPWRFVKPLVAEITKEEIEGVRRLVLAYATTALLGNGSDPNHLAKIIDRFSKTWWDSPKPSLVVSCYWLSCVD